MPRLFLAVWPAEQTIEALCAVHRKDGRGVRFVAPENWHVTLRFLGECDPEAVIEAMGDVVLPPARADLGRAVEVLSGRALVVPVGGLDEHASVVAAATRDLGQPPPKRRFFGHLTIARLKRDAVMPRALGTPVSSAWEVDEIALVQSRLHPDGARYETSHTWPLTFGAGGAGPAVSDARP